MGNREIDTLIKPVEALIEDGEFWRHQSDGLAIFVAADVFRKFTAPISFQPSTYVSDSFYLIPLIPLFNDDGLFYLLTLKPDGVKFYEVTRYSITDIDVTDIVPSAIEDIAGYDYERESVKFRVQQSHKGAGVHHGYDKAGDDAENSLLRFFREVDSGLMTLLYDNQKPPLVLACLDSHFSVYRNVNSYRTLFPQNISGNPDESDVFSLHGQAWDVLQLHFREKRKDKVNLFLQAQGSGNVSSQIEDIVPAAFDGRIDTLFIQANTDIYGKYNKDSRQVELLEQMEESSDTSLLNLIAVHIIDQGGSVYFAKKEDMRDKTSKFNALLRY